MKNPIEVKNLTKSFILVKNIGIGKILRRKAKKITILDDISFTVQPGSILGVIGRNGAGKSTLLRLLGNVYGADSGFIMVRGDIAAIFELGSTLNQFQTGRKYAHDYLYFMGVHKNKIHEIVEEIKEFTELDDYFEQPVHTYSSGMKAKLLFGVATSIKADVFLIDEVLVVGDGYFQSKAWKRLQDMIDAESSGVIVSHDWTSLVKLCRRVLLIQDKKIAMEGPAAAVINKQLGYNEDDSPDINLCNKTELSQRTYEAESGKEFTFEFDIYAKIPPKGGVLGVDFYIERYVVGDGWNRVFNCESEKEIRTPGEYHIRVHLPTLPLVAGFYQMSIEMFVPLLPGEIAFSTVYTKMNWLNGQALPLTVTAPETRKGILAASLQWKAVKCNAVSEEKA